MGFTPHHGARRLCNQRVYGAGGEEIHWVSYSVREDFQQVVRFYSKAGPVEVSPNGRSATVRSKERVLSIHSAKSGDYPGCDSLPALEEQTIIVVSRMLPRH
jgi:hypothetical protein